MQKVLTAEQMREVDRLTTDRYGIPSIILMENAAHAVARVITEKLGGSVKGKSILILCGKGNNGGDGAALARILSILGAHVEAIVFSNIEDSKGDARVNFDLLTRIVTADPSTSRVEWYSENSSGTIRIRTCLDPETWQGEEIGEVRSRADAVVDALFGTGLVRPLSGIYSHVAQSLAWEIEDRIDEKPLIFAIDIPSGLNADVGYPIGENASADYTVTFTAPKPANILPCVSNFGGELIVADIGSPAQLLEEVDSELKLVQAADLESWFWDSRFHDNDYKNKRGHTLIVAGSEDYSGAAVMCGNSAMRSGVGLTTLLVPASCKVEVASRVIPEVIVRTLAETDGEVVADAFAANEGVFEQADSLLVGPGLKATDKGVVKLVREIIENRTVPVVVDAGALWFFNPPEGLASGTLAVQSELPPLILTPHEGEFLRLLGTDDKAAIKDRVGAVRDYAVANNVILVLKGERVLIGSPDGRVVVNPTGNSGLGKAGNGDTLAGILAGFIAQAVKFEIDIFETVVAAVYVAGMAGDVAEKKFGKRVMTASDVRECLVYVFTDLSPMATMS